MAVNPAFDAVDPVVDPFADPVLAPLLDAVEPVIDPVEEDPVVEGPVALPVRASAPPIELDPMFAAPPETLALTSMTPPAALLLPDVPVAPVVVVVEALLDAPWAPEPDTRHPVTTTFWPWVRLLAVVPA